MTKKLIISATLLLAASLPWQAKASTFDFSFGGSGVSGSIDLTYGSATDSKYSQGLVVTGISGSFSDTNNGLDIVNAPISSLVGINPASPDPTNHLAPGDFSKFAVTTGLPVQAAGALTYDDLYYPGGSPQTATDYPVSGGFLDIYGLMFNIGGGRVVNFWSNGLFPGSMDADYGAAVATSAVSLDYTSGSVSITPEPSAFGLLGSAMLGMFFWQRRLSRKESE